MARLIKNYRYFECDACNEVHDAGRHISCEQADRELVCCPSGLFIPTEPPKDGGGDPA